MQMKIKKRFGFAAVLLLLLIAVLSIVTVGAAAPEGYHEITTVVDGGDSSCKVSWTVTGAGDILDGKYCLDGTAITVTATAGPGYELDYLTRKDASGETALPPGIAMATEASVTEDLTFIAHFKAKTYTVVYGSNQSDVSITTDATLPRTYVYGSDAFELYIPKDTAAYTFVGWYEGENAIKIGTDGKYWYKPNTVPAGGEIRLVAHFEPRKIGGFRVDMDWLTKKRISPDPIEYTTWKYRDEISADETLMNPDGTFQEYLGYTFVTGNAQYYETKTVSATKKLNEIIRYYVPNVYRVTFDACGGNFAEADSAASVTFNQKLADIATEKLPTREGYAFAGFFTERDGRGTKYIDGNGTGATWTVASDTTLYAYWIPRSFELSFSNALTAETTITVKHGDTVYTYDGTPLSFPYGTVVSVTVKAQNGYKLVAWNGTAIAHAAEMTVSFTIPAENTELTGTVLPVCSVPSFRADYPNETLTAEGGIPSGSYVLRVDGRDIPFDGTMTVSLSEYFGKTVQLLCRGDGTTTADSEWFSLALAARPESPIYGEGGKVEKPSATENSVSFTVADGETVTYEFACVLRATDKPVWQDSGSFAGLKPGTTYTFYIRVKATETAPHGEVFSMTVYTLNENYLKGEIEKLRGEVKSGDGKNVSDLITVYVTRMEALEPSADYQEELEALMRECREKLALARYKDGKITEIDARCAELLAAGLFNEAGKETLADLQADAIAAINGAATTQGVDNARRDFDAGVEEIPVRIDLTGLLIALGIVIFCQIVVLIALLSSRARYADRVRYARAKTYALCPLPVVALTARFLPEKPALIALLLGAIALVLQIVITVLLFRSTAISKRGNGQPPAGADPNAQSGGNVGEHKNENGYGDGYGSGYSNGYGKGDRYDDRGDSREFSAADPETEDEPATDSYAFAPQMSILGDDGAPAFDRDDSADALQEEDWYDETFEE